MENKPIPGMSYAYVNSNISNDPKELFEAMCYLQALYSAVKCCDNVEKFVTDNYQDAIDDLDLINERTEELFNKSIDEEDLRQIGYTNNYFMINRSFLEKDDIIALEAIKKLESRDILWTNINELLKIYGLSYHELCHEQRRVISPKEIDNIIIERFSLGSNDSNKKYYDRQGLATLFKQSGKFVSRVFYDDLAAKKIVNDKDQNTTSLLNFSSYRDNFEDYDKDRLVETVEDHFKKGNVSDYSIFLCPNTDIYDYLTAMFIIRRQGKVVNDFSNFRRKLRPGISRF